MGQMIDGKWHEGWYDPDAKGAFQRPKTVFRDHISSGPGGAHPAAANRYHLYVSYACPWAHRTLIMRALRGLEEAIPVTVVDPKMGDGGWEFSADDPDPIFGARHLREIYAHARKDYTGRVTVPILWDTQARAIVNNESREVMRMLDVEFHAFAKRAGPFDDGTYAPEHLRPQIDATLDAIYEPVNNGVYRAGFARSQEAYEHAARDVFTALDHWEGVLGKQRYLCGDTLTEADVAMFTTLLRFDEVYYAHFKCNLRRIQDYPNLWGYLRDLYQVPEIRRTCRLDHIKTHYYWSQTTVNPTRIVPIGPTIDLDAPHDRARFGNANGGA